MTHYYITAEGQVFRPSPIESTQGYTPVVVIDPEDQLVARRLDEALTHAFAAAGVSASATEVMQAALRSLLEPPKPPRPDEPLGLGAVVEDTDGERWVRWEGVGRHQKPWTVAGSVKPNRAYADIDAVSVLSPGVPDGEV